jgi:hypothetical protein
MMEAPVSLPVHHPGGNPGWNSCLCGGCGVRHFTHSLPYLADAEFLRNLHEGRMIWANTVDASKANGLQPLPISPDIPTSCEGRDPKISSIYPEIKENPDAQPQQLTVNPLCLSEQFQHYRQKHAATEDKKAAGGRDKKQSDASQKHIWPDILEVAFLDGMQFSSSEHSYSELTYQIALLLIPHMGRKKHGQYKQQGRNMLVTDYLWIVYCRSLPPGQRPDPQMKRTRKQVSSHIQVLKAFFKHHPYCEFTLQQTSQLRDTMICSHNTSGSDSLTSFRCIDHVFFSKEQARTQKGEGAEVPSLDHHPVLQAIAEGRMPQQRPNYDYFSKLLSADSQVRLVPSKCWLFVANNMVVVQENGTGYDQMTGIELPVKHYPHLGENNGRGDWPCRDKSIVSGTLLHQFTKPLEQTESSSICMIQAQWTTAFPALAARLNTVLEDNKGDDNQLLSYDILHMDLTLEMQKLKHFPAGSELNNWVEISIQQPDLLTHRWKVMTYLQRPVELLDGDDMALYHATSETSIIRRPTCEDSPSGKGCLCSIQRTWRDVISVPFPADIWARIHTVCAEFPDEDTSPQAGYKKLKEGYIKNHRKTAMTGIADKATKTSLVSQIAMLQEIWSSPQEPEDSCSSDTHAGDSTGSDELSWGLRALVLWTFDTVHCGMGDAELGGRGQWRFLTIVDAMSQEHQRRSLLGDDSLLGGVSNTPSEHAGNLPKLGEPSGAQVVTTTSSTSASSPNPLHARHTTTSGGTTYRPPRKGHTIPSQTAPLSGFDRRPYQTYQGYGYGQDISQQHARTPAAVAAEIASRFEKSRTNTCYNGDDSILVDQVSASRQAVESIDPRLLEDSSSSDTVQESSYYGLEANSDIPRSYGHMRRRAESGARTPKSRKRKAIETEDRQVPNLMRRRKDQEDEEYMDTTVRCTLHDDGNSTEPRAEGSTRGSVIPSDYLRRSTRGRKQ